MTIFPTFTKPNLSLVLFLPFLKSQVISEFGNRVSGTKEERKMMHILPDCDWHPSVIVDVLRCGDIQNVTAPAPEFSDRVSILKEHVKEPIPKVLLLSWDWKKKMVSEEALYRMIKFNTSCNLIWLLQQYIILCLTLKIESTDVLCMRLFKTHLRWPKNICSKGWWRLYGDYIRCLKANPSLNGTNRGVAANCTKMSEKEVRHVQQIQPDKCQGRTCCEKW